MAEIPKLMGIEITQFTHYAQAHYETEYWIELKIAGIFIIEESGKPVQKTFVFGKEQEDIYVVGAHKFEDIKELLEEKLEATELTVSGDLANYPKEFQAEVYVRVLASLMKTRRNELEQLRLDCNELAELLNK